MADFAGNHRIRKVGTDGLITTVAGDGLLNDGDFATNATLKFYFGARLRSGWESAYIADWLYNHRIRKVDTNGVITTVAGNGLPAFSGDGGAATNAQFELSLTASRWMAGEKYICR